MEPTFEEEMLDNMKLVNTALRALDKALAQYEITQTEMVRMLGVVAKEGSNLSNAMTMTRDFIELTRIGRK